MATRLAQLRPEYHESPNPSASTRINFICPSCFQGRVLVDIRLGEPKDGSPGRHHGLACVHQWVPVPSMKWACIYCRARFPTSPVQEGGSDA